jgi:hypothetical protein
MDDGGKPRFQATLRAFEFCDLRVWLIAAARAPISVSF